MAPFTFRKEERLTHRSEIAALFDEGKPYKSYPFLLLTRLVTQSDVPTKVVISVSKRRLRRAHDRNRMKRLIREAWRHEKPELNELLTMRQRSLQAAVVFTGKEVVDTPFTREKISALARRLKQDIANLTLPETP